MDRVLFLPIAASEHGPKIDQMLVLLHILMGIVFVGWTVFFVYTLLRFRKKRQPRADYRGVTSHASSYLEGAVALAEGVLLIGFSIPFWIAEVDALPAPEANALQVRVQAQQYVWYVHYPGADGLFGQSDPALIDDQVNLMGLVPDDPNGKDDIVNIGQLHLPVGRPVVIRLSSRDVIHSFSLPEFRVKQDVIPGMSIPVHFTPTMTTQAFRDATGDPARNFEIACAQLCGLGHYRMRGFVTIESEEAFQTWLEQSAPGP